MAERSRGRSGRVVRTERIAPQMIRVVLGGEGLADFAVGPYTDSYVKLAFPLDDVQPERSNPAADPQLIRGDDHLPGRVVVRRHHRPLPTPGGVEAGVLAIPGTDDLDALRQPVGHADQQLVA